MAYALYRHYQRQELPPHPDEFFVIGERAMFVARRGRVRFEDRSTCSWPQCSPKVAEARTPIDLFLEHDGGFQYLGEVGLVQYGQVSSASPPEARFHLRSPLPRERWLALQEPLPQRGHSSPETAIAALTSGSSTGERIAALQAFVESWFGPGSDAGPLPAVPTPLAALYRLVGAHPKILAQNTLLPPHELTGANGRRVFYVENQHVCEWAFDADGDDPLVWFRINEPGERWQREHEPLSGFVIQLVLFEALIGSVPGFGGSAGCLDSEASERLRDRFAPLPLGPWCWGPTSFHARDGALLSLMGNGEDGFTAMVAAQHPDALTCIVDLVDDSWESVAF